MVAHDPDPMTDPMTDSMFDSFADPMTDLRTDCKTDPRCNVMAVLHPCDVFLRKTRALCFFLGKNSAVWPDLCLLCQKEQI